MSVEINPGWEDNYWAIRESQLCGDLAQRLTDAFSDFLDDLQVGSMINPEQRERSQWKVQLIIPRTVRRVVNMVKGSIKYTSDDWSAEIWQDMGLDDKADGDNYEDLFHDFLKKRGLI